MHPELLKLIDNQQIDELISKVKQHKSIDAATNEDIQKLEFKWKGVSSSLARNMYDFSVIRDVLVSDFNKLLSKYSINEDELVIVSTQNEIEDETDNLSSGSGQSIKRGKDDVILNPTYAGFWIRLAANILDFIIAIPFAVLILFLNNQGLNFYYFTIIPAIVFNLWWNVYLVKHFGGSPGKLIVGIKIIKVDGKPVEWREAFLRHVVSFISVLLGAGITIHSLLQANELIYDILSWTQKAQYLRGLSPSLYSANSWFNNIWVISESIILLTNEEKRAAHDFIAGTVVIKK